MYSQPPPPPPPPPPYGPPPYGPPPYGSWQPPPSEPPPRPRRGNGFFGWLLGGAAGGAGLFKILLAGKALTLLSALGSFGIYAVFWGPAFAAGLVIMIFIHEMGHVVEIRRQGIPATAPVFIPFIGASILQRSRPIDAYHQALIGIAGPIAGTLGATIAFLLYKATGYSYLLGWAWIGFVINLINLIPLGMLDGGWVLGAVSKWFQVFGLGLLAVAILAGISPFFAVIVLVWGFPAVIERFARDRTPYYQAVPTHVRYAIGTAWFALVVYLIYFLLQVHLSMSGGQLGLFQR